MFHCLKVVRALNLKRRENFSIAVTEPSPASRRSKLAVGRREAASRLSELKTTNVVKRRRGRAKLASPSTTSTLKPTTEASGCETQLKIGTAAKLKKSRISCAHRKEGVQERPGKRGGEKLLQVF